MAARKVGTLIKQARTDAGYTQTALAAKIPGLTASDISKAERGEKELTTEQLKAIARLTGVTQKSLLDAASGTTAKKPATGAKKPSAAAKKPAAKTPASATTSMKVTATEKKLIEAYRNATTEDKKAAMQILKGTLELNDPANLIGNLLQNMMSGRREMDMDPEGELEIVRIDEQEEE